MRKVARFIMFVGQLRGVHALLSAEQTNLPALQTIVILLLKNNCRLSKLLRQMRLVLLQCMLKGMQLVTFTRRLTKTPLILKRESGGKYTSAC